MDERVDAVSMQEIWDACSPLSANDQKPLFKAEQEAEKALGYLEGLSLAQLSATLLTSGLNCCYLFDSRSNGILLFYDDLRYQTKQSTIHVNDRQL
jgi:hypothetical protein